VLGLVLLMSMMLGLLLSLCRCYPRQIDMPPTISRRNIVRTAFLSALNLSSSGLLIYCALTAKNVSTPLQHLAVLASSSCGSMVLVVFRICPTLRRWYDSFERDVDCFRLALYVQEYTVSEPADDTPIPSLDVASNPPRL
jgi:hypothetical protein